MATKLLYLSTSARRR